MKKSHRVRFENWQRLCPAPTRRMVSLVVERLIPGIEREGFSWVDVSLRQPDHAVDARMIELERWAGAFVDSVTFNFDKYRLPRFQIHASRRTAEAPHEIIRSANLVANASQYLHFWGKPWWLPTGLWSDTAGSRTVSRVASHQSELVAFLESGARTRHISRSAGL